MPIPILMPALSPTMTEGNLIKWHKNKGDPVKAGEVLAEIETDKATMEVEAVDEGILGEILIPGGTENVKVNAPIALLLEEGEDPAACAAFHVQAIGQPPLAEKKEPSAPVLTVPVAPAAPQEAKEGRLLASPLAKRIAAQQHVTLETLQGSGPHGRIIKRDVEQALAAATPVSSGSASGLPGGGFSGYEPPYTEFPLTMMRKIIAKRLIESKQSVPHFYLSVDCRIDALLEARKVLNAHQDVKISVNDIIIRACALTLQQVPEANVAWAGDSLRLYERADIAVAVAIEGGLMTPIIRAAETKGLLEIATQMKDFATRARAGKLKPEEFQGGTFSLSNLGMFGIASFSAILNPPQACILAIGAGEPRAVVQNGVLGVATVLTATLSVDHRAIDGAVAAQFLKVFKELLEEPIRMLC